MLAQPKPLILYNTSSDSDEGVAYIIMKMDGHFHYWVYGKFDNGFEWKWYRLDGRNWIEQRWDSGTSLEMPSNITKDDLRGMLRKIWSVRLK